MLSMSLQKCSRCLISAALSSSGYCYHSIGAGKCKHCSMGREGFYNSGYSSSMNHMHCPSCQKKDFICFLKKIRKAKIFVCKNCDLHFSKSAKLSSRKWYEKSLKDKTAMTLPEVWLKWQKKIYAQFLRRSGEGLSLLDVGCGDGKFLKQAQDRGYHVTGIDLNSILVNQARKEKKIEYHAMDFKQFRKEFSKQRFNVITFFQVLEHMKNPNSFINMVRGALNPGGYIAFSVPNRDRFRFATSVVPQWDSPPHHRTWWNKVAIKHLLKRKGFRILQLKEYKKQVKIPVRRGWSKQDATIVHQLSYYSKFKYYILKNTALKLSRKKFINMRANVKGPYLYVYARLEK